MRNYKQGQDEAVAGQMISVCLNELEDGDTEAVYRQWLVICLATCWDNHEEARGNATHDNYEYNIYNYNCQARLLLFSTQIC